MLDFWVSLHSAKRPPVRTSTLAFFQTVMLMSPFSRLRTCTSVRLNSNSSYLYSSLRKVTPESELLARVHVGVVRLLKYPLHLLQLERRKRRPVASFLASRRSVLCDVILDVIVDAATVVPSRGVFTTGGVAGGRGGGRGAPEPLLGGGTALGGGGGGTGRRGWVLYIPL